MTSATTGRRGGELDADDPMIDRHAHLGADAGPADGTRDAVRTEFRDPDVRRQRPREPHEMYDIHRQDQPRGMDLMWAAVKVRGAPNQDRLNDFIRTGWRPARAEDYPELSGFDVNNNYSQTLIDLGFARRVGVDDPVISRDLMLLVRPKALSQESRAEDLQRANRQIDDHMNRLRQVSARQIGAKNTQVRRSITRSADAPTDLVTGDEEMELG